MKRILTRTALTVLFLSSLTIQAHSAMDGSTEAKAFTHIGMVRNLSVTVDKYYYFNLSGNIIKTYLQADRSLIVLRDYGSGLGDLPVISVWFTYNLGRFILPSAALAELDGITRLRLSTGPTEQTGSVTGDLVLDAVTTNSTMIQKVRDNETLHRGFRSSENLDDNTPNASWVDTVSTVATNSSFLTGTATGKTNRGETLEKNVFHPNGAGGSTVFIPSQNHQVVKWISTGSTIELADNQFYSLSVRADPVAIPLATGTGNLVVTKTASEDTDVEVDDEIIYTYVITNNTADMIRNISMSDVHDGKGTFGQPDIETGTITEGTNSVTGDSYDLVDNDKWDGLAPGDALTVTATYTVTQADIDELQSP